MFFPGYPPHPHLLSRHMPPLAEGVAAAYIEAFSAPGDLVVDPFGQSPRVALEAVQLGRRALVATNNPILRLALGAAVQPVAATQLRVALTRLADARVVEGRLETYVRRWYQSTCPDCRNQVEVDAFHWEKSALAEKSFHCDACHEDKTRPVDEADRDLASRFSARGPQFHWALDRVIAAGDDDADLFADALDAYTPRALSAIFNLTNKALTLGLEPDLRRALDLLLAAAYDEALSLEGQRPRTLKPHARFRERNIWLSLERLAASDSWQTPLLLDGGPEAAAAVRILDGSLRALAERDLVTPHTVPLCLAALPRPNLVLWVLSSVWAGLLWGEPAARSLRMLIRRRRYDWAWHETALRAGFQSAQAVLAPGGRLVGLLPEAEPGFLGAALTAADAAGYTLVAHGLRAHPPEAQFVCQPDSLTVTHPVELEAAVRAQAALAAERALRQRGEPSRWPSVSGAAFAALAGQHLLRAMVEQQANDPLDAIADLVEGGCLQAEALLTFRSEESEAESPRAANLWWWLAHPGGATTEAPLSDRIETEVAHLLAAAEAGLDLVAFERALCERLAALTLPGGELVRACLDSYGEERDGLWFCRNEDHPSDRAADMALMQEDLVLLGQRLNYRVEAGGKNHVSWRPESGQEAYQFYITDTAIISPFIFAPPPAAGQRVIVIPGGRAGLIHFKLKRNPLLKQAVEQGDWNFLKYRHIRRLLDVDTEKLPFALLSDPITEKTPTQLPLL